MDELSIPSDYMRRLIEKLRVVMGRDRVARSGDMSLREVREEIDAMDREHQNELVALVWLGREDFTAEEWPEALSLAGERHVGPTSAYLLSHPRVADQLASGLEELGYSHVLQDGNY